MQVSLGILLAVIIVFIVVFIAIGFYFVNNKSSNPTDIPISDISYNGTVGWSASTPSVDCTGYQFPLSSDSNSPLINPITATYNPVNIALATPDEAYDCVDSDRLNIATTTHTCDEVPSTLSNLSESELAAMQTSCIGTDGQRYDYLQSEQLYLACSDTKYCPGYLAVIATGLTLADPQCMSSTNGFISAKSCNINLTSQQWRVILSEPEVYPLPTSSPDSKGKSGNMISITDRVTSNYVFPANVEVGSQMILRSDDETFGLVWLIVPSLIFEDDNQLISTTPPQLVYVGNLTTDQQNSISFDDPQALANFFNTNNNYSMRQVEGSIFLDSFFTGNSEDPEVPISYNCQYISTINYNFLYLPSLL